jgi:hypothetical protein
MVHWLTPPLEKPTGPRLSPQPARGEFEWDLNRAVDGFDLEGFLADFDRTGADWLIFSIGQNKGTYSSPNEVLAELTGSGRHTSRRDLALEIARAVKRRGKRFIAYLPAEIRGIPALHAPLGWSGEKGSAELEFQRRYLRVVREWAERLGPLCDGWWFDGCHPKEPFHNRHFVWEEWYNAARAGNPDRVLAFNDGSFSAGRIDPIRPEHDYTAGETVVLVDGLVRLQGRADASVVFRPRAAYVDGTACLWHALLPIDSFWGYTRVTGFPDWVKAPFTPRAPAPGEMDPPMYSDDELGRFVRSFTDVGGAVTLNVGIFQGGRLGEQTLQQLERLRVQLAH